MARLDYRDDDPKDKDRYYDEMDAVTPTPAFHRSPSGMSHHTNFAMNTC